MRVLTVGDVVGPCGVNHVVKNLKNIIKELGVDFTIINGENAASTNGITKDICDDFYNQGCDCITLGNHTYNNKNVAVAFDFYSKELIRPLNYDPDLDGEGYTIIEKNGVKVGIINLLGRLYINPPTNCPFKAADKAVEYFKEQGCKVIIIDFHAEATSEKKAMAYYLDGKVSAVFGTHTHTQTSDEQILEGGTGYLCDIGMTGSENSVLGLKKEISINRIVHHKSAKFESQDGNPVLYGCVFQIDENSGKCQNITRIKVREDGKILKNSWL